MSSTPIGTRERILQETRRLMEERRGQNVRLEDIAKAAGVSRQAVYLHFGSRTELLVATARYLDEVLGLPDRLQPLLVEQNSIRSLERYVDFWANYIPEVYGLAKAFLNARETDEAAAAAWNDRMAALYDSCVQVIQCLDRDHALAPQWATEEAIDFLWGTLSVATWENLTIDRGWTQEQFVERMKMALKRALVAENMPS